MPDGVINLITNDPDDAADVVDELIAHPAVRRDQLHRLDAGRADHRRERRPPPQARAARAGRQGADGRAGRRRPRPRGGGGQLRRVLPPGPDLHVDRAGRSSTARSPTRSPSSSPSAPARSRSATRASPTREIGPLINGAALERVTELVQDAVSKGAEVVDRRRGGRPAATRRPCSRA